MLVANYIILFIIIISLGILYQKYLEKQTRDVSTDGYSDIRKYLLKDKDLDKSKKPILWIYIPYEYNSRNWLSFGSRNSFELNQPYLYLTMKTIVEKCDESFNICIFDDSAFHKMIPNWDINLKLLAGPLITHVRQLAIAKMLYLYGGMVAPISFLCLKDLSGLYKRGTNNGKMFLCEKANANVTSSAYKFYPDMYFMGPSFT